MEQPDPCLGLHRVGMVGVLGPTDAARAEYTGLCVDALCGPGSGMVPPRFRQCHTPANGDAVGGAVEDNRCPTMAVCLWRER